MRKLRKNQRQKWRKNRKQKRNRRNRQNMNQTRRHRRKKMRTGWGITRKEGEENNRKKRSKLRKRDVAVISDIIITGITVFFPN